MNLVGRQYDKVAYHQERGLALNPNNDLIVVQQGEFLTWTGQPDEGVEWIRKAMRLNPHHPERFWNHLGRALFVARGTTRQSKHSGTSRYRTTPIMLFSRRVTPRVATARRLNFTRPRCSRSVPTYSAEDYLATLPYQREADVNHHRDALAKARLRD